MPNDTNEVRIQKKREASINSSAALHSAQWRARCQRKGSRWVPLEVNEGTDAQRTNEENNDTSSTFRDE